MGVGVRNIQKKFVDVISKLVPYGFTIDASRVSSHRIITHPFMLQLLLLPLLLQLDLLPAELELLVLHLLLLPHPLRLLRDPHLLRLHLPLEQLLRQNSIEKRRLDFNEKIRLRIHFDP